MRKASKNRFQVYQKRNVRVLLFLVLAVVSLSMVKAQMIEVGGASGKVWPFHQVSVGVTYCY